MSVTLLVPYQCPPCFLQPRFQCSFRSRKDDGRGGCGSTAADEWRYRDKSRTCWWVLTQGVKDVSSFSGFPTTRRQRNMVYILSYTYSYDSVKVTHTLPPCKRAWRQHALLKDPSLQVYILLYAHSPWYVFFNGELFDVVSTTQNLAHNMQQFMEFQSGLLAVTLFSLQWEVAVGVRWASGSPSTNLSEWLFVHCWYFGSLIPAQHQTHWILSQSCLWFTWRVAFVCMHCIMKLVVLEWLPWLLTNWRGNSWEVQVLV